MISFCSTIVAFILQDNKCQVKYLSSWYKARKHHRHNECVQHKCNSAKDNRVDLGIYGVIRILSLHTCCTDFCMNSLTYSTDTDDHTNCSTKDGF